MERYRQFTIYNFDFGICTSSRGWYVYIYNGHRGDNVLKFGTYKEA